MPRLRTERLLLREWREPDRAPFAALNADPEVARFLAGTLSREQSDALIDRIVAHWRDNAYGLWAVERTADRVFIGFTGLSVPSWATEPAVEVGWRLARDAWGHGYATEAARAAVRFGFEVLRLPEIVSYTAVANEPSRRVMDRLGMRHDPAVDFLHPRLPADHPLRPHVTYRLARTAWESAGPTR